MSELQEFVKKRTSDFSGISCRKIYGLDAFYLSDIPFIVISSNEQIIVKVDDFEVKKTLLKIPQVSQWILNDKVMENWFLLPDTFNKKKNKLAPILEMTSKALLHPRKEKTKRKKKSKTQNNSDKIAVETVTNVEKNPSFFKRLCNFIIG
ncbi:hypothetical protein A9Q84_11175 [Halobacteriovorax marinus]|uniref:TfoX N-terminal domain-containing protein n=1 Tax=Halobacteriovorax marinus TaxID=97084 RepID=A0A1Y5FDE8_9BACT|nr:hypothetical protein A9Q84_11175 [Halobacteriovorax marinus]